MTETVQAYDPWDPDTIDDPYPAYRWLRQEHPCYHNPELDMWALSRYEDVAGGLRDHVRLSSADGTALWAGNAEGPSLDPPEHTKWRRVGLRNLSHGGLRRHEETIRALADEVVERAVASDEPVDVMSGIATPLAYAGLMGVVGTDAFDRETVLKLSDTIFARISSRSPEEAVDATQVQIESFRQADEIVEGRKLSGESGGGDIVDAIIACSRADEDGWRLDRLARGIRLLGFVGPGLDTVRHTITNGFDLITRFPEEWERVRSEEVSPESFVEEVLRFEPAVQGFFRGAREDIDVAGGTIPAGARVMMLYASANRDEEVFEDADRFRADRGSSEHLALGAGIHYCQGAALARIETTALFASLARRASRIERAGVAERQTYALMRGWRSLPVLVH